MRSIEVSNEVWQEIAKRGKFGETEDDVLRRVFNLPPDTTVQGTRKSRSSSVTSTNGQRRRSRATQRLSAYVNEQTLNVEFAGGPERSWELPARADKAGIRTVRDEAVDFVKRNGATLGQQNAVKKALTDAGFHLIK